MPTQLKTITKQEQVNILAQYLRDDILHAGKNIEGDILRHILQALATLFLDFRDNLILLETEMDINKANSLLDFYETLVGIPDDCLPIANTIEERRRNILLKFAWLQGNFKKQVEYILELLLPELQNGVGFSVQSAAENSQLPQDLPFPLFSDAEIFYTIVIKLPISLKPLTLPQKLPFSLKNTTLYTIKCLVNKLKPAHVKVFYQFFNDIEYQYTLSSDDGYSILTDDGFAIFT